MPANPEAQHQRAVIERMPRAYAEEFHRLKTLLCGGHIVTTLCFFERFLSVMVQRDGD